jgi:hypothetical protein
MVTPTHGWLAILAHIHRCANIDTGTSDTQHQFCGASVLHGHNPPNFQSGMTAKK